MFKCKYTRYFAHSSKITASSDVRVPTPYLTEMEKYKRNPNARLFLLSFYYWRPLRTVFTPNAYDGILMRIFTPYLFFQCVFNDFQCVITLLHALSVALNHIMKVQQLLMEPAILLHMYVRSFFPYCWYPPIKSTSHSFRLIIQLYHSVSTMYSSSGIFPLKCDEIYRLKALSGTYRYARFH